MTDIHKPKTPVNTQYSVCKKCGHLDVNHACGGTISADGKTATVSANTGCCLICETDPDPNHDCDGFIFDRMIWTNDPEYEKFRKIIEEDYEMWGETEMLEKLRGAL